MEGIKIILEIFNSLLSPIIAIIVTYIAYQQWKTNKEKANRDKNAAIIDIYLVVKEFLSFIDENRKVDLQLYISFKRVIAEADFLCEKKLVDWLENIDSEASDWLDCDRIVQDAIEHKSPDTVKKDLDYMEKNIDNLQEAHCHLLEMFKEQIEINRK